MRLDPEQFARIVTTAIKAANAPLVARIAVLEQRPMVVPRDGIDGRDGKDGDSIVGPAGKDADLTEVLALKADVESLKVEWATKSVRLEPVVPELPDIPSMVVAEVSQQIKTIQMPRDGQDGASVTVNDVAPLLKDLVTEAVAALPQPKDGAPGASVDMATVEALVTKAVDAIERPKDGVSITVADVEPLVSELVLKAVDALPKPKDGIGVSGALVDRAGHLVLTFTNGSTKDVGPVVGSEPDPALITRQIADLVAQIPYPKDGKDGRDGTLENLKVLYDGERTITWAFKNGDPVEGGLIKLPVRIHRGVFREEKSYEAWDVTTFGGSEFTAQRDNPGKPEIGDGWRLTVKRGRDGKAGRDSRELGRDPKAQG